jgi:hypothetical protein
MKILDLRKKTIINFSVAIALITVLSGGIFYNIYQKNKSQAIINKTNIEASDIKNQTMELENKTTEFKKHKIIWDYLSENKKSTAKIKMSDVNARLSFIADKYSIFNQAIKVTLPENLEGGLFDLKTLNVLVSTVNLSFQAVNDVKALSFISEFTDSLPGYVIVTNLQIKKEKDYSDEDLVALSSGNAIGAVSAKVDFFWYAFKDKDDENAKDAEVNDDKSGNNKSQLNSTSSNAQPLL